MLAPCAEHIGGRDALHEGISRRVRPTAAYQLKEACAGRGAFRKNEGRDASPGRPSLEEGKVGGPGTDAPYPERMAGARHPPPVTRYPLPATRYPLLFYARSFPLKASRFVEEDAVALESGPDAPGVFGEGNNVIGLSAELVGFCGGKVTLELEDFEGC